MTTYKEVFQLAEQKGCTFLRCKHCESIELDCLKDGYCSSCYCYDNTPTTQWAKSIDSNLLILTLIQKWLRDEHKICAVAAPLKNDIFLYQITFITARRGESYAIALVNEVFEEEKRGYKCPTLAEHEANNYTYEEALLNGIYEALKLL